MEKIKNFKEFFSINEGMFDNGIKRAHTKEVRTEDNFDLLDKDNFFEYLEQKYKGLFICINYSHYIELKFNEDISFSIDYKNNEDIDDMYEINHIEIYGNMSKIKKIGIIPILKQKYSVKFSIQNAYDHYVIKPKNFNIFDKINNNWCIEVLNIISNLIK